MNSIERVINLLYEYAKEHRSNILILHKEQSNTQVVILGNKEILKDYARAMVNIDAKTAEEIMVNIAEALEYKELKNY